MGMQVLLHGTHRALGEFSTALLALYFLDFKCVTEAFLKAALSQIPGFGGQFQFPLLPVYFIALLFFLGALTVAQLDRTTHFFKFLATLYKFFIFSGHYIVLLYAVVSGFVLCGVVL